MKNIKVPEKLHFILWFTFIVATAPWNFANANIDSPKICLLSSVLDSSYEGEIVLKSVKQEKPAGFFPEARFSEIRDCLFSDRYDVVIWIMHGTEAPSESEQDYSLYSLPSIYTKTNAGSVQKMQIPQFVFEKWLKSNPRPKNLKKIIIAGCGLDLDAKPVFDGSSTIYYHSSLGIMLHYFEDMGVEIEMPDPTVISSIETFMTGTPTVQLTQGWLTEKLAQPFEK
ncbi:MAG: hypothetical protein ACXVCY_07315 [Pseudobdellovibrionaceae bacterium]